MYPASQLDFDKMAKSKINEQIAFLSLFLKEQQGKENFAVAASGNIQPSF
jgi:hypothetical protein